MKSGLLFFWGLVFLALAGLVAWRMNERARPTVGAAVAEDGVPADLPLKARKVDAFVLTDQDGHTVTAADLRGKVAIYSFFFANCPGVCLKLNQTLADLQKQLGDADIRLVSVSVDPEHDTPERLKEYAARFSADPARWVFLTGELPIIKRLAENSFQVTAAPSVHSDRFMLVDQQGKVRGSFRGSEEAQVAALKREALALAKEPS